MGKVEIHLDVGISPIELIMIIMVDCFRQLYMVHVVDLWFLWLQKAKGHVIRVWAPILVYQVRVGVLDLLDSLI